MGTTIEWGRAVGARGAWMARSPGMGSAGRRAATAPLLGAAVLPLGACGGPRPGRTPARRARWPRGWPMEAPPRAASSTASRSPRNPATWLSIRWRIPAARRARPARSSRAMAAPGAASRCRRRCSAAAARSTRAPRARSPSRRRRPVRARCACGSSVRMSRCVTAAAIPWRRCAGAAAQGVHRADRRVLAGVALRSQRARRCDRGREAVGGRGETCRRSRRRCAVRRVKVTAASPSVASDACLDATAVPLSVSARTSAS